MNEFILLSKTTNELLEDIHNKKERRKLSRSIQNRYSSAANTHEWHCSRWDGNRKNDYLYVKADEFYDWIKDKHPELIPKLPKEHQRIWKKCYGGLKEVAPIDWTVQSTF